MSLCILVKAVGICRDCTDDYVHPIVTVPFPVTFRNEMFQRFDFHLRLNFGTPLHRTRLPIDGPNISIY